MALMRRGAAAFRCAVAEMQGWRIGHEADGKATEDIDMTRPRAEMLILLMEEIPKNHLGFAKPCKSWDKLPTSTGEPDF